DHPKAASYFSVRDAAGVDLTGIRCDTTQEAYDIFMRIVDAVEACEEPNVVVDDEYNAVLDAIEAARIEDALRAEEVSPVDPEERAEERAEEQIEKEKDIFSNSE